MSGTNGNGKSPESRPEIGAPRDRDKALSAGYLRLLGHTQEEAAKAAGVGERTLREWETCSWWPGVLSEANERWLSGLAGMARRRLLLGMADPDESAALALKVLERMEPRLAPPKQAVEHSGRIGVEEMTDEELVGRAAQLTNRVAAHTNGNGKHGPNGNGKARGR